MTWLGTYLYNVLLGIDLTLSALTGGGPWETISYRLAHSRARGKRLGCILCRILDRIDPDHCHHAFVFGSRLKSRK